MDHRTLAELEAGLPGIRQAPADEGVLELIARRPAEDEREEIETGEVNAAEGLVGDTWRARGNRHTPDGSANIEAQLTIVNTRVSALIAGPRDRWSLAGDQLYIDFDISEENAPAGTQLQIGDAIVEISSHPHSGCKKFADRFGSDALRFVNTPGGRAVRARGVNARVIQPGSVWRGATIRRAPPAAP